MSVLIQGDQIRALLLGVRVERATATLPQTTQSALFTVTGGRVLVTSLTGEVTTAIGATATNASIVGNPTTGTDVVVATATAVTSKEVGSLIAVAGTVGTALNVQNAGAGAASAAGFVAPVGTLDLLTTGSTTGSVKWTITYIPLDNGASVAAA